MTTLTNAGHETLIDLLTSKLGKPVKWKRPSINSHKEYVAANYVFKHWEVDIRSNGSVMITPTESNMLKNALSSVGVIHHGVARWSSNNLHTEYPTCSTPEEVADKILRVTESCKIDVGPLETDIKRLLEYMRVETEFSDNNVDPKSYERYFEGYDAGFKDITYKLDKILEKHNVRD